MSTCSLAANPPVVCKNTGATNSGLPASLQRTFGKLFMANPSYGQLPEGQAGSISSLEFASLRDVVPKTIEGGSKC